MKALSLCILLLISIALISCIKRFDDNDIKVSTSAEDIRLGFVYLNMVRNAPSAYSSEIGVDLGSVEPRVDLIWNDTLVQVATTKCRDMADRNYFAHVDPDGNGINIKIHEAGYTLTNEFISHKSDNNFESLSAGTTEPIKAIKALILDENTYPPGHRQHLLGVLPFWSNCYDIGIGFVAGNSKSDYVSYCCVLIAKHDF